MSVGDRALAHSKIDLIISTCPVCLVPEYRNVLAPPFLFTPGLEAASSKWAGSAKHHLPLPTTLPTAEEAWSFLEAPSPGVAWLCLLR